MRRMCVLDTSPYYVCREGVSCLDGIGGPSRAGSRVSVSAKGAGPAMYGAQSPEVGSLSLPHFGALLRESGDRDVGRESF